MTHILDAFLPMRAMRPVIIPHRRIRVQAEDGVDLLIGVFERDPHDVEDVLLFYHGAGAHMGAGYLDFGADLFHAGCGAVLLPDLRGHGRSGGVRGALNVDHTLWRDVDTLVSYALQRYPRARLHVGGHSLGAGLSFNWMTHSNEAFALARKQRLQSLFLLAPYTGLTQTNRTHRPPSSAFITRPFGLHGEVHFDYSADVAARGGLVRAVQAAMFDAMAPMDFLQKLRRLRSELPLSISILLLRDDELLDADLFQEVVGPLANEKAAGSLRIECIPGGHLSGLFTAGKAAAEIVLATNRFGSDGALP